MRFNTLSILLFVGSMTLIGCGGGGGGGSTTPVDPPEPDTNETIIITESYQVESLGSAETINANISLGNLSKDLYLVLSNSANTSGSSTITHNAKVSPIAQEKLISTDSMEGAPSILRTPQYVREFNTQIPTFLTEEEVEQSLSKISVLERVEDTEGQTGIFYLNQSGTDTTVATARKVVSEVPTSFGAKTLNVWVSNDSFGSDCIRATCVTQNMVDALADSFLTTGLDNDIYDWVTNIYGEEWDYKAEEKYSQLILESNEITILLTDIDDDNSTNGGVVGFFWSKDNFDAANVSGSNERVMFYIDSVMFANGDNGWDIDDYWPKELISTLAHEFHHMINFYQKYILLDANNDTWINEMLSESTEDIIATKLGHNVESRYPLFNANNTLSLTEWNNDLEDYSKVNVFGAYLLRNYGGAKLLHDIMHNSYEDERAVVDAVNKSANGAGKTFSDLLSEWGVAVMLSDRDDLVDTPVLNIGTLFESVYNSTTYYMNSINLFNYNPKPRIYSTVETVAAQGNYYYLIGEDLTGDINVTLELNGQTEATLIAK